MFQEIIVVLLVVVDKDVKVQKKVGVYYDFIV